MNKSYKKKLIIKKLDLNNQERNYYKIRNSNKRSLKKSIIKDNKLNKCKSNNNKKILKRHKIIFKNIQKKFKIINIIMKKSKENKMKLISRNIIIHSKNHQLITIFI